VKKDFLIKTRVFIFVIFSFFSIIIIRLYNLQIVKGEYYSQKAENNFLDTVKIRAQRGNIYDKYGKILAKNIAQFNLYVNPKLVDERTIKFLKKSLKLSIQEKLNFEELFRKNKKSSKKILIKSKLSRKELSLIEARMHRLLGVTIVTKTFRYYPERGITAHVVGYINRINPKELSQKKYYQSNDNIGKSGIESYLENSLRGHSGKKVVLRSKNKKLKNDKSLENLIELKNKDLSNDFSMVKEGDSVYLTLDLELQKNIDDIFFDIKSGAAVVFDTNTGDILALYSKPTFDPNIIVRGKDKNYIKEIFNDELQPTLNKAYKQFFPGSVFKVVTAIAALDLGIIDEKEKLDCPGYEMYGSSKFRCWKHSGHGKVDLEHALAKSCDVYFYKLAKKVGLDNINKYAKKLGVGTTFTDFISSPPKGFVPNKKWYYNRYGRYNKGTALNTAIGQGDVYLSPFKVAEMYSIIANYGIRKRVNIVDKIITSNNKVKYKRKIILKSSDLPTDIFQKVAKGLFNVVNMPGGTAYYHRLKNILVSGKTGTAQVASKTNDEYEFEIPWKFRHHAWFAAFAPSYKPEIAVVVLVEHGEKSSVSARLTMEIIKSYEDLKIKRAQAIFLKERNKFRVENKYDIFLNTNAQ